MRYRIAPVALAVLGALVTAGGAWAHAHVSPPVALAGEGQVFTLAVPTEKEGATTTSIALTPPSGFSIDSFFPAPGWKRSVEQSGSGEDAAVEKVTWTGGSVPTGEDASFSFLGRASGSGHYSFAVEQTYSDGSVVDWSGPESADTPAPVMEAVSSFGGGTSTLTIVALALGAVGVVLGAIALLVRSGRNLA
jgi:uncharacterized protein YcnI